MYLPIAPILAVSWLTDAVPNHRIGISCHLSCISQIPPPPPPLGNNYYSPLLCTRLCLVKCPPPPSLFGTQLHCLRITFPPPPFTSPRRRRGYRDRDLVLVWCHTHNICLCCFTYPPYPNFRVILHTPSNASTSAATFSYDTITTTMTVIRLFIMRTLQRLISVVYNVQIMCKSLLLPLTWLWTARGSRTVTGSTTMTMTMMNCTVWYAHTASATRQSTGGRSNQGWEWLWNILDGNSIFKYQGLRIQPSWEVWTSFLAPSCIRSERRCWWGSFQYL